MLNSLGIGVTLQMASEEEEEEVYVLLDCVQFKAVDMFQGFSKAEIRVRPQNICISVSMLIYVCVYLKKICMIYLFIRARGQTLIFLRLFVLPSSVYEHASKSKSCILFLLILV